MKKNKTILSCPCISCGINFTKEAYVDGDAEKKLAKILYKIALNESKHLKGAK